MVAGGRILRAPLQVGATTTAEEDIGAGEDTTDGAQRTAGEEDEEEEEVEGEAEAAAEDVEVGATGGFFS